VKKNEGFDWIIVVSSDKKEAEFWQKRLNRFKGKIVGKNAEIISQYEDWPGGAGQLLGTLHAFKKANKEGRLEKALRKGKKVAIYHTAGKGKRLAPIIFSEGGNKSAVKLPKILKGKELFTILDVVIFQTQIFAKTRPGRLCVFWGDQIIIPSGNFGFEAGGEAEIFGIRKEVPVQQNIWEMEWQHYGILVGGEAGIMQREKLSWDEFKIIEKTVGIKQLSKSLGSFSLSGQFLTALLKEFNLELTKKSGKLDTDFHLWTPLTSSKEEFLNSGGDENYWERINKFKEALFKNKTSAPLIIDKNLGENTFWLDFGQVSLYYQNLLKLAEDSNEGEIMRRFFGLEKNNNFISFNSKFNGKIKNSLILNSEIGDLNIEDSIIINSKIKRLIGKKVLIYNLKNLKEEILNFGEVVCGVGLKNKKFLNLRTNLDRDGKKDWENKIFGNPYSYQDLEKLL